ncbi:hypothetical protein V1505DRAFT_411628 [Lipomyces doorenjongii]
MPPCACQQSNLYSFPSLSYIRDVREEVPRARDNGRLGFGSEASDEIEREIKKHGGELVTDSVEIPNSIAKTYPVEHESECRHRHAKEIETLEKASNRHIVLFLVCI